MRFSSFGTERITHDYFLPYAASWSGLLADLDSDHLEKSKFKKITIKLFAQDYGKP